MAEEYQRRETVNTFTPETRFAPSLATVAVIVTALVGGAITLTVACVKLDNRVERLTEQIESMRKERTDIGASVKTAVMVHFDAYVKRFSVNCNREALRGKGDVTCPAVLLPEVRGGN